MASREERAKLRAAHANKMQEMGTQPTNHATFDAEIPTPKTETSKEMAQQSEVLSNKDNKKDTPINKAIVDESSHKKVETAANVIKMPKSTSDEANSNRINSIAKSKSQIKEEKVKVLEKYSGPKKTVKIVAKEEDMKYWIKQSRKNSIPQQDYLALILLDTIERVKKGQVNDESEEVLEYQRVLHNMAAPINAQISAELIEEVKEAAADLCMKQSGFFAYSLYKARESTIK